MQHEESRSMACQPAGKPMNAPIRTRWWPRSCNTKRVIAFNDHWLDEKELFYETSVRIPMLLYDLAPAADATAWHD